MSKPNGYVLYQGPSMLDGDPIVAIVTGINARSTNRKTGEMLQTYILRADMSPREAVNSGADGSICGDCPHRGTVVDGKNVGRSCYVTLMHGPRAVYDGYVRGIYPATVTAQTVAEIGRDRPVRLGTYGDPAAVPVDVWLNLLTYASNWTGYTHQWRKLIDDDGGADWRSLVMASVDTLVEAAEAQLWGWRTFRVGEHGAGKVKGEFLCPASEEAGKVTSCDACGACQGTSYPGKASVFIPAHGAGKSHVAKRLNAE